MPSDVTDGIHSLFRIDPVSHRHKNPPYPTSYPWWADVKPETDSVLALPRSNAERWIHEHQWKDPEANGEASDFSPSATISISGNIHSEIFQ